MTVYRIERMYYQIIPIYVEADNRIAALDKADEVFQKYEKEGITEEFEKEWDQEITEELTDKEAKNLEPWMIATNEEHWINE